jgi:hypothetical protein
MSLARPIQAMERCCPRPRFRPEDCPHQVITALISVDPPEGSP